MRRMAIALHGRSDARAIAMVALYGARRQQCIRNAHRHRVDYSFQRRSTRCNLVLASTSMLGCATVRPKKALISGVRADWIQTRRACYHMH